MCTLRCALHQGHEQRRLHMQRRENAGRQRDVWREGEVVWVGHRHGEGLLGIGACMRLQPVRLSCGMFTEAGTGKATAALHVRADALAVQRDMLRMGLRRGCAQLGRCMSNWRGLGDGRGVAARLGRACCLAGGRGRGREARIRALAFSRQHPALGAALSCCTQPPHQPRRVAIIVGRPSSVGMACSTAEGRNDESEPETCHAEHGACRNCLASCQGVVTLSLKHNMSKCSCCF